MFAFTLSDPHSDPAIRTSTYESNLKRNSYNFQPLTKKSLSTQKILTKIPEKRPLSRANNENKDTSNFSSKPSGRSIKFQKLQVTAKSQVPENIPRPEEISKGTVMKEMIRIYNDPRMKTKTLPDNFNIEHFKELEFSLERIDKKAENNANFCFQSIDNFSMMQEKAKMDRQLENLPKKPYLGKNQVEIKDLEKFFNKKAPPELLSPNSHQGFKLGDRTKVNSNYEKEKKASGFPSKTDYQFPTKSRSIESVALSEAQTTLLYFSKINDHDKCFKILTLREFAKQRSQLVNFKGSNDWCPIHYASLNGNSKLVDLLLVSEAEIDAETSSKLTPLMIACQKGHEEICTNLINAGADINLADLSGNTALHYGVLQEQKRIVELLLKKPSINTAIKNNDRKTARDEATMKPEILIVFDQFTLSQKGCKGIHNKVVIHKVNNMAISNFLGKHFYRFKAKAPENPLSNISNIQTTATYSSNSNTANDLSFLGMNEDEAPDFEGENEKISLDSFNIKGLIGRGSFGEVFLVEKKDTKIMYALKVLKKSIIMKNNLVKYALTERNVLSLTNHPFIVKLVYAFQSPTDLFLIMDYCPGGDLGQQLQREKKFTEERTKVYLAEIILALEDLHKRDIIFRDLKPDNIVLDKDGHALLTDFGLSKEGVLDPSQGAGSFCGSLAYLAPEMLKRCGHGKAVDWYLLGVVMYEMLVGTPPYYTTNKEELFTNIETASLKMPANLSPHAKSLLKALLQRNPAKRLGSGKGDAEEIKAHQFFKGMNWVDVEKKKLKLPLPEIRYKFNPAVKGEELKQKKRGNNEENENTYVNGWSFVSPNNKT